MLFLKDLVLQTTKKKWIVLIVEYRGGKIHNEFYATLNSYLNIISTFPLCTES